ncbi:MAG: receptor with intracellular metal dependent phosphohydrolase [Bacteroidetes bacterium]|nr:receptor with intracellular metal dependent phosphohydrolase [Bacteroidota bacterium]
MKFKITQETIKHITKLGLFIALIAIIVQLFPKDKKFKYQYELGKPWTYELITASYDFPIYKTEKQLEADKEELMQNYAPYFQLDENISKRQINKWRTDWKLKNNSDPKYNQYLEKKLNDIYSNGIVSSSTFDRLKSLGRKNIVVVKSNRLTSKIPVDELFTPKAAYEDILLDKPYYFSESELSNYNLNLYLVENLRYDSITSEAVKQEMFKNLSLTSGMVQAGERIIDRGEIITPGTFSILNSMKIASEKRKTAFHESYLVLIGEVIMIFMLILLLTFYLYLFRPYIYGSAKNLFFIALMMLLIVALSSLVLRFTSLSIYIVPFALLPVIIRVFFDSRTGLFAHIITVLIISFMVDNPFLFIILQITAGMAAVSGLKDMTQRSQLTQTAFYIFLSYTIMYLASEFIAEGDLTRIHFLPIINFGVSSLLLLFAYVLIYILEKIFGLISAITLVELTNINSDLMMKFAELAPGTFQHSLQVSNLATEAAKKINANSLLVRTGALYHDIGKMKNPQYFIENQEGGKNPLLDMSYEEAAKAVVSHIADGVAIAKKYRLPEQIVGFITDAVEARSRTLDQYTNESISEMVENMIDTQIADGQLKDAPISFRDVETVKRVFTEKIKNIYHNRITYPELKNQPDKE